MIPIEVVFNLPEKYGLISFEHKLPLPPEITPSIFLPTLKVLGKVSEDFVPFQMSLIGLMDTMIIVKWLIDWDARLFIFDLGASACGTSPSSGVVIIGKGSVGGLQSGIDITI